MFQTFLLHRVSKYNIILNYNFAKLILLNIGMVTQTLATMANFTTNNGVSEATMYADLNLAEGKWISLAHIKVYTTTQMYSIAVAKIKIVKPPPVVIITETILVSEKVRNGWFAFAILSSLICLFIAGAIITFRQRKVIKYATSTFCIIMAIGATLGAIAPIPYADSTESACMARPLLPMLAFTLFFVPLVLKTWRVHQLFQSKNFRKQSISDLKLISMLTVFVLVDIIIYSIWMSTDARPIPTRNSVEGSNYQYTVECTSDANDTVFAAVAIYKGFILLTGSILAYSTRKVPSLFNESKYIAQCQYVLILFMALGIPLIRLVNGQPDLVFAISTIVMSFSSVFISILFFAPKFWIIYTVDDSQLQAFKNSEEAVKKELQQVRRGSVASASESRVDSTYIVAESDIEQGDGVNPTKLASKPAPVASGNLPSHLLHFIKVTHSKTSNVIDRNAIGYIVKIDELSDLLESCKSLAEGIHQLQKKMDKKEVEKKINESKDGIPIAVATVVTHEESKLDDV